jgi:hypothetical protein
MNTVHGRLGGSTRQELFGPRTSVLRRDLHGYDVQVPNGRSVPKAAPLLAPVAGVIRE